MYGKKYTHTECGAEETKRRRKEKKREEKRKTDQKNPQKGITKPKNHRHIVRSYISLILSEQSKVYGLHHSFDLCVTHKNAPTLYSGCFDWCCPISSLSVLNDARFYYTYIYFSSILISSSASLSIRFSSNIFTRNQRIMCQRSQKETKYTTHAHSHIHTPNNAKKESLDRIKWKVFYVRCGFDFFLSLSLCHSFSILLWSCVYRYCCCLHSFFFFARLSSNSDILNGRMETGQYITQKRQRSVCSFNSTRLSHNSVHSRSHNTQSLLLLLLFARKYVYYGIGAGSLTQKSIYKWM